MYANSYKIFALTDSPYLKHILTVNDTSSVMNRSDFPWLVYAVEPELTNNIPAARSIAFDITLQGVGCFYKTFYYNLLDQNKLDLVLELSAPGYTDSVYFEQVTETGQVLETVGALIVTGSNSIYHQLVNEVPPGTTFWRVRIRFEKWACGIYRKNHRLNFRHAIYCLLPKSCSQEWFIELRFATGRFCQ